MAVTTYEDKMMSNKILIHPDITFYGLLLALFNFASDYNRKILDLLFPKSVLNARTSPHDRWVADKIYNREGMTFCAVMLALISQADTDNLAKFENAFPEIVCEAKIRYYSPGQCLTVEEWIEVYPDDVERVDIAFLESLFDNARIHARAA